MTPALSFMVIHERNCNMNMEMSFFAWNIEMSFFVVCPYIFLICAPKIGMNRRGIVLSSSGCNSSRFSGPYTHSYVKGIPQKKTSPCSSYASLLRKRAYHKKRHLRALSYSKFLRIIEGVVNEKKGELSHSFLLLVFYSNRLCD